MTAPTIKFGGNPMSPTGTSTHVVVARSGIDVPTSPFRRPDDWPARLDRNRETGSPIAASLAARTPDDVRAERALATARDEAARRNRNHGRRGKEPAARTSQVSEASNPGAQP